MHFRFTRRTALLRLLLSRVARDMSFASWVLGTLVETRPKTWPGHRCTRIGPRRFSLLQWFSHRPERHPRSGTRPPGHRFPNSMVPERYRQQSGPEPYSVPGYARTAVLSPNALRLRRTLARAWGPRSLDRPV